MYSLGIDIGASSVKAFALGEDGAAVYRERRPHQGDPLGCLRGVLLRVTGELGAQGCLAVVATGSGAGLLADVLGDAEGAGAVAGAGAAAAGVGLLEDVPAITRGAQLLAPEARSIIEVGGQNACYLCKLDGGVPEFSMNESCAAGTGAFFEDQMTRLGLSIEDFSSLVAGGVNVPRISGRCAVFAKTDIIHRQQEGVGVQDLLLGLCYAMVKSFKALIVRGLPVEEPVALSGGVLFNGGVVRAVREVFGLGEDGLMSDESNLYFQAAGAALEARDRALGSEEGRTAPAAFPLDALVAALGAGRACAELPRLQPLPDSAYTAGPGFRALPKELWERGDDGRVRASLGIDVGSTSTDLVLLDARGRVLDAQYLRTGGDARDAVRRGLASLGERLGNEVEVTAVATTGSGRGLVGKLVGADAVVDEITCQAAGAAHVDPLVDTVFEIGGQDSKFIALNAGQVADFQMNKVCAAGTGSFIEEQAARLGIPLSEYGPAALASKAPVDLGERCTVFVETSINAALAAGAAKGDVAAGLALSIVRNYLHRVVGSKRVGSHIVLQGGVAYNPAVVEAFRSFFPQRLTVSPDFAVSGAVGAALMAAETAEAPGFAGTAFKGFDLLGGRAQARRRDLEAVALNRAFYNKTEELFLAGYTGERDPAKKTVGVPRCLMLHRLFPLARAYFAQLGYNVVLSPNTDEELVRLSQESAQGETCYPVKIIYGHMAWLAEQGVDYIFMPRMRTIRHAVSKVAHNYACPYMQTAPEFVARALGLEKRGIRLLSPLMDMDFGQKAMATALLGLGEELGHTREQAAVAMMAGGFAVTEFGDKTEALGAELLDSLAPGERVLVLITRNYGISDNALNMGVPQILLDRGQKVITLAHLHGHDVDVSADHPGICWPFGQHILSGAKIVRRDPRLFAVYLTNHGCGPDTMLNRLFAEEMGEKPYLQIECDEHFSSVGVATRVEAFLNALAHLSEEDAVRLSTVEGAGGSVGASGVGAGCEVGGAGPVGGHAPGCGCGDAACSHEGADSNDSQVDVVVPAVEGLPAMALSHIPEDGERLEPWMRVGIPSVGAYGDLAAAWLRSRGFDARPIPVDAAALEAGRAATSTKEYATFAALMGASLAALGCAEGKAEGKAEGRAEGPAPLDALCLPETCGADAHNQYARCIRAELRARGRADVALASPRLEVLPWALERCLGEGAAEELFSLLLAGDALYALPPKARPGFLASCIGRLEADGPKALEGAGLLGLIRVTAASMGEAVAAAAGQAGAGGAGGASAAKRLSLVGEWACVYLPVLAGGLWDEVEARGLRLARMPLSEYFWALWSDEFAEYKTQGSYFGSAGMPWEKPVLAASGEDPFAAAPEELDRRECLLRGLARSMGEVSATLEDMLGEGASPFEPEPARLLAVADSAMGRFRGSGGRYRAAKVAVERRRSDGVIAVASLYENTDTVLRLMGDADAALGLDGVVGDGLAPGGAPVLRLAFDATLDGSAREKLASFLYYLR